MATFPLAGKTPETTQWGPAFGAPQPNKGFTEVPQQHQGSDLFAPPGTPVVAAHPGTVTAARPWSGRRDDPYGTMVDVKAPTGESTRYAHLQQMAVTPGQPVRPGQPLGTVGHTGNAQGDHLHFEAHDARGQARNPQPLLAGGGGTAVEPGEPGGAWAAAPPGGGAGGLVTALDQKRAEALQWALNNMGAQNYYNLCEKFIENAYGTGGQYASAAKAGQALGAHTLDPSQVEPGDLVFFKPDASNGGYGHVGIALGNGDMVSATNKGVTKDNYLTNPYWNKLYLGTADPPSQWQGNASVKDIGAGVQQLLGNAQKIISNPTRPGALSGGADGTGGTGGGTPVPDRVARWAPQIEAAAQKYDLPPQLLGSIVAFESGGDPNAQHGVSGATGLGQVMPREAGFANRPSAAELKDPETNLDWSAKILSDNYKRYGSLDKAAAGYLGAIDRNGNISHAQDANGTDGFKYVQEVGNRMATWNWGDLWQNMQDTAGSAAGAAFPGMFSPQQAAAPTSYKPAGGIDWVALAQQQMNDPAAANPMGNPLTSSYANPAGDLLGGAAGGIINWYQNLPQSQPLLPSAQPGLAGQTGAGVAGAQSPTGSLGPNYNPVGNPLTAGAQRNTTGTAAAGATSGAVNPVGNPLLTPGANPVGDFFSGVGSTARAAQAAVGARGAPASEGARAGSTPGAASGLAAGLAGALPGVAQGMLNAIPGAAGAAQALGFTPGSPAAPGGPGGPNRPGGNQNGTAAAAAASPLAAQASGYPTPSQLPNTLPQTPEGTVIGNMQQVMASYSQMQPYLEKNLQAAQTAFNTANSNYQTAQQRYATLSAKQDRSQAETDEWNMLAMRGLPNAEAAVKQAQDALTAANTAVENNKAALAKAAEIANGKILNPEEKGQLVAQANEQQAQADNLKAQANLLQPGQPGYAEAQAKAQYAQAQADQYKRTVDISEGQMKAQQTTAAASFMNAQTTASQSPSIIAGNFAKAGLDQTTAQIAWAKLQPDINQINAQASLYGSQAEYQKAMADTTRASLGPTVYKLVQEGRLNQGQADQIMATLPDYVALAEQNVRAKQAETGLSQAQTVAQLAQANTNQIDALLKAHEAQTWQNVQKIASDPNATDADIIGAIQAGAKNATEAAQVYQTKINQYTQQETARHDLVSEGIQAQLADQEARNQGFQNLAGLQNARANVQNAATNAIGPRLGVTGMTNAMAGLGMVTGSAGLDKIAMQSGTGAGVLGAAQSGLKGYEGDLANVRGGIPATVRQANLNAQAPAFTPPRGSAATAGIAGAPIASPTAVKIPASVESPTFVAPNSILQQSQQAQAQAQQPIDVMASQAPAQAPAPAPEAPAPEPPPEEPPPDEEDQGDGGGGFRPPQGRRRGGGGGKAKAKPAPAAPKGGIPDRTIPFTFKAPKATAVAPPSREPIGLPLQQPIGLGVKSQTIGSGGGGFRAPGSTGRRAA